MGVDWDVRVRVVHEGWVSAWHSWVLAAVHHYVVVAVSHSRRFRPGVSTESVVRTHDTVVTAAETSRLISRNIRTANSRTDMAEYKAIVCDIPHGRRVAHISIGLYLGWVTVVSTALSMQGNGSVVIDILADDDVPV